MLRTILAGATLMLAAGAGFGAQWIDVDKARDHLGSFDAASLSRSGDVVRVWVKVIFFEPQRDPAFAAPIKISVSRWAYDCRRKTMAVGTVTLYGEDRSVIASQDAPPVAFRDVPPDTSAELMLTAACRY